jgi:hypothetical protein
MEKIMVCRSVNGKSQFKYLKPPWKSASKNWAKGAKGTVHVFHSGEGVRLGNFWATVEYPALINSKNSR